MTNGSGDRRPPSAVDRFSGFADGYDRGRPQPPAVIADLLSQYAGLPAPLVVDLAAGTGLSTSIWEGRAGEVIAIEPSPDMRRVLTGRLDGWATRHRVQPGTAEATGLPDGLADVVTAGQAMHWFDPDRALPEIHRILRPGGVFCAFDYDLPPLVDPFVDAAFATAEERWRELDVRHGLRPPRAEKEGHLGRLRASGLFAPTREVALHRAGRGTADDLLRLADTLGDVQGLRGAGLDDEALGIDRLRATLTERMTEPTVLWWTYRLRLGVRGG